MNNFVTRVRGVIRGAMPFFACLIGSQVYAQTAGQPATPDTVFGIRIGQPLESQFGECPKNEKGEYGYGYHHGNTPCWKQNKYGREVTLPDQVLKDTNAAIDSMAKVTVSDGVVVEVEVYAHRNTWRQAERYMLRHYGKPLETETYEMASRVFGQSKHRAHTWRANGVTLYFAERASNENARIRAFSDAWAKK